MSEPLSYDEKMALERQHMAAQDEAKHRLAVTAWTLQAVVIATLLIVAGFLGREALKQHHETERLRIERESEHPPLWRK